jgi:ABC-2 type transport system permease protein
VDLGISWAITRKDLSTFRKKRGILLTIIIFPLFIGIAVPLLLGYAAANGAVFNSPEGIAQLDAVPFLFFILLAGVIPTAISSYAILGEKLERSLEPLLATPATDEELLTGKVLSALVPTLGATYAGGVVYIILADAGLYGQFGYLFYPNASIAVILFVVMPLAILMDIEMNVIISSRVSDTRTAYQLGTLLLFPFLAIYFASVYGAFPLDIPHFLLLSGFIALIDLALYFVVIRRFNRDRILTAWR